MSWKQSEKPKTLLVSPALVREFMEMEPVPHDRPLSEKRMQVYERILRSGEFRTVVWASCLCAETGGTYRVNGKHTATLLSGYVKSGTPLPDFYVTVERYYANKLTDVANLYNTFDSTLASRTTRDINMAFAATIPVLKGVHEKIISLAVMALAFHKWDENELKRVPPAERAEELLDNSDFVKWLECTLGNASGGSTRDRIAQGSALPLRRAPVAAAMLATYRKGPRMADEFWKTVRDETAPTRDDPTRVLNRFLTSSIIAGGKGGRTDKKSVGFREMYVKCIHAWNAWRKGERTQLSYHAKAPLPQVSK